MSPFYYYTTSPSHTSPSHFSNNCFELLLRTTFEAIIFKVVLRRLKLPFFSPRILFLENRPCYVCTITPLPQCHQKAVIRRTCFVELLLSSIRGQRILELGARSTRSTTMTCAMQSSTRGVLFRIMRQAYARARTST